MKNIIILSLALLMFSCCDKTHENCKTMNNNTMEDLLTRRSVRSYTDEMPPMEVIEEICKAGTYAPT